MPDPFDLTGRTALITGGSRGIGAAVVEIFCEHGASVVFCHLNDDEAAKALAARLSTQGYAVDQRECDIANEEQVAAFFSWAEAKLGSIDILVNCAGVGGGNVPFESMTVADWDRMLAINLRGAFLMTHLAYAKMAARGWGRIINISSQLAYKGSPEKAHYCAAKAGLIGFTRALSYEGAPHNVLINAIAPGPVDTDMLKRNSEAWRDRKKSELPINRFGRATEIAPTALLLASDAGSFYVGQTLSPNGGDIMF
jgi:3-oxoacyl-[acyl-carrier protein] reductase